MTSSAADKVNTASVLPIRLVILATFLALALIASMGWYVWNSVHVLHEVQVRTFRLLALTGEIADLNESVWASARPKSGDYSGDRGAAAIVHLGHEPEDQRAAARPEAA